MADIRILDQNGVPIPRERQPSAAAFGDTAHHAASATAKDLRSWTPAEGSADADLLTEIPAIRSRSRDLVRNHGIASGAMNTLVDNVIGAGLRLAPTPDWRALGRDNDWAREWVRDVQAKWRVWAESFDCDAGRSMNFNDLTAQIFRSVLVNGEGLGLSLWLPDDGDTPYGSAMQLVEPDRLSNPHNRLDTDRLRAGVEINRFGAPQAYHIRRSHPGDYLMGWVPPWEWERVPARTPWGRRRVVHCFEKDRVGATRGKPILTAVMPQFKMLDHYQRAEIQSAVTNALIAAFIETPLDAEGINQLFGDRIEDYVEARNSHMVKLQGGAVIPLYPGDRLSSFTPNRPATAYPNFVETVLRHIATGINLPYELLLKDFSKSNYSSARAALLEAWRYFATRRKWLAAHWAQPVYELWLEEAVERGDIEAPGFRENRPAYARAKWIGPGRGWIDPVKEAQAAKVRMDIGVSTLEAECAEQGLDWEEVLEQRARERAKMQELGLTEQDLEAEMAVTPTSDEPAQQQQ